MFKRAVKGLSAAKKVLDETTAALNKDLINTWSVAEEKAMKERGEALRIFDVQVDKGMWWMEI